MPDLGIGEAALIAGLVGGGATATAGIYGANKSAGAAETAAGDQSSAAVKAAQIQADAANHSADLTANSAAQALALSRANSQLSLDQYNQQQTRLQPYRNLGSFALGQPFSAAPAPLSLPPIDSSGTTPNSSGTPTGSTSGTSGGANYAPLIDALNKGQNPQAVIQQYNSSQAPVNGESYAWRSIPSAPGGGVVEIPGGAYLAPGPNGQWGYTAGSDGGGGGSTPTATAGPVKLNYTPTTLGSMMPTQATVGTLQAPAIQAQMPYRSLGQISGVA